MIRLRNLICTATKLKLYNAFIFPHFLYCCTVCHFSSTRNCDKLESLNKHALRIVFNDGVSSYQKLLHKPDGANLHHRRIQNMLITIYKCLNHDSFSKYLINTCLLCVSLNTPSEKRILYHFVNLLPLLMASTLFVTSQLRNGTPYLIM